jgi:Uma2 family endonuclease
MGAFPDLLARGHYTRDEVRRMEDAGELVGRFELLEGDLIDKMGQNAPHAQALRLVAAWLINIFGPLRVQAQLPIEVAEGDQERSEPEPDVAVLQDLKPDYDRRHPRGDELILLVEVSDSSSRFDLSTKALLYARAGAPEYWVLDITRRMLIIHRVPEQGVYKERIELGEHDFVSLGDSRALVSELLPRAVAPGLG